MPETVIASINELSCNEPNQFINTDRRGRPIGNIYITGVDRYAYDINRNQAPQDPPHQFQSTQDAEDDIVVPDPNIDLGINHETHTEQVQATKEPYKYPITVTV